MIEQNNINRLRHITLILPTLADVGHGILATLFVGLVTGTAVSWQFLVGIVFALLPDADAVPRLIRTGSVIPTQNDPQDHREYMHYPVVFLIVGVILLSFSTFLGLLFIVATMLHFFNDSWGTGHGLKWLWPLSSKKYKMHTPTHKKDLNLKTAVSHGSANQWIDDTYLHLTPIALIEYAIFITAIIGLLIYLLH